MTNDRKDSQADRPRGLVCHSCGCQHFTVVYTRARAGKIMRRRECRNCGRRITTWEHEIGQHQGPQTLR
ncbi:MAG: hypothetical protein GX575_26995 [Candidatus Anammoximicrobium sp.]|nr:hypothetical protein [Candidatus Anammoximicrobium sp.]